MTEVRAHGMPESEYRFRELERRLDRAERAAEQVPIIARDVVEVAKDVAEIKDEQRNVRRALYTAAISIATSSILFVYGATELLK